MKHFNTIAIAFIVVIAVILACNILYMVRLYQSIRNTVEKDVMTAITDADLDELWLRLESKESQFLMQEDDKERQRGEISAGIDNSGLMKTETRVNGETVSEQSFRAGLTQSYNNLFSQTISQQLHALVDTYIPANLEIMDSVLTVRLNNRFIYPEFVAVEILDSVGNVLQKNPNMPAKGYDQFTLSCDPIGKKSYHVYMTPLTRHILSEMAGIIITVFLLMVSFALAFSYLFRTVSKMRTIEEMKDDFVSNMTHELKTPIAIAYSANDALLNYDTANDPQKKVIYLKIANKQLKRLGELVENILAMSMERRKTLKLNPEIMQLRPFVEEIAAAQRMRGEKEITIDINIDKNMSIEADKTHLSHILNNLIDNAIKYSGDSVKITIYGNGNEITVADNGIGIPAKSIPYLFNKFYRVSHGNRQDVRGYGIGLYYVKSILDKMGWSIRVKSKEGKGSVFTVMFSENE